MHKLITDFVATVVLSQHFYYETTVIKIKCVLVLSASLFIHMPNEALCFYNYA